MNGRANNAPRFSRAPRDELEGDRDVFAMEHHHPVDAGTYARHQSLLVKLPKSARCC